MPVSHRIATHNGRSLLGLACAVCLCTAPLPSAAFVSNAHNHASSHPGAQHAQGYLGIEFHDLTDEQANALHLRGTQRGAEVVMVDHDGPAGKAGLRAHDIIVALNGQAVDNAVTLRRLIHDAGAGVSIGLQILRSGHTLALNARLANREEVERDAMQRLTMGDFGPAEPPASAAQNFASMPPNSQATPSRTQQFLSAMMRTGPFTGLSMETMTPQLAGFFGVASDVGLLVNTVMPNSPAAAAGIHAGDILLRADNVPLHSTSDWTRHLRSSKGHAVVVAILRDRRELTLMLTPDLKHHSEASLPDVWPCPAVLNA